MILNQIQGCPTTSQISNEARLKRETKMISTRTKFPKESSRHYYDTKFSLVSSHPNPQYKSKLLATASSQSTKTAEILPTRNTMKPKIRFKNQQPLNTGVRAKRSRSSGSLLEMTSTELTKLQSKGKLTKEIEKYGIIGQIKKEKCFNNALLRAVVNGAEHQINLIGDYDSKGSRINGKGKGQSRRREPSAIRKNEEMNRLRFSRVFEVTANDVTSQRRPRLI